MTNLAFSIKQQNHCFGLIFDQLCLICILLLNKISVYLLFGVTLKNYIYYFTIWPCETLLLKLINTKRIILDIFLDFEKPDLFCYKRFCFLNHCTFCATKKQGVP